MKQARPIISADAKELVIIKKFQLFCQFEGLNLDKMTAGSSYSGLVLLLRGRS